MESQIPKQARSAAQGEGAGARRAHTGVLDAEAPGDTLVPPGSEEVERGALQPGLCFHQYELIRELGRGGVGQVFLARDRKLARKVAIKFLNVGGAEKTRLLLSEARATARCSHENIVVLHDADEHLGRPFLVLEYLKGRALGQVIREGKRLAPHRAVETIVPVIKAMVCAHEFGIVHRDLKPDNIFLCDSGIVKVLDFSIAKVLLGPTRAVDPEGARELPGQPPASAGFGLPTERGKIFGSPAYMSPEQWRGEPVDHRTDIWSAGMILFKLIGGEHPLAPASAEELKALVASAERTLPKVSERLPAIPAELGDIIDRCLAKRAEARYTSAQELLTALLAYLSSRDGEPAFGEGESPYPGLAPFTEREAPLFFGRTRELARIASQLETCPLVAIVGPSGAGKSSFVRAGLIPRLMRSDEPWHRFVVRPGRDPLAALAAVSHQARSAGRARLAPSSEERPLLSRSLRDRPGSLGTDLRALADREGTSVLLFVDQFEELYTLLQDPSERRAFVACLAGASDDVSARVRVVIALRSDFLDRLSGDSAIAEELPRGLFLLRPPERYALTQALTAPAKLAGYTYEDASLVDEMLGGLEEDPSALPLLQFTASRLWERRNREQRLLTRESYRKMGGIGGALTKHADDVLESLPASSRRLAREILLRLTTAEGTRTIADVDDLLALGGGRPETQRVIDHLTNARLLILQTSGDDDGATVELVHESLIRNWPTFQRWLDESHGHAVFLEQLRVAAKQWARAGRPAGLLWRGESMQDARRFARRYPGQLSSMEQSYLDAVIALDRRSTRMRRAAVAAIITFLLSVVAVGAVALVTIRRAEQKAKRQTSVIRTKERRARKAERAARRQFEKLRAEQRAKRKAELAAKQARTTVQSQRIKLSSKQRELNMSKEQLVGALGQAPAAQLRAERALETAHTATRRAEGIANEMKQLVERERRAKLRYRQLLNEEKVRNREKKRRAKQIENDLK